MLLAEVEKLHLEASQEKKQHIPMERKTKELEQEIVMIKHVTVGSHPVAIRRLVDQLQQNMVGLQEVPQSVDKRLDNDVVELKITASSFGKQKEQMEHYTQYEDKLEYVKVQKKMENKLHACQTVQQKLTSGSTQLAECESHIQQLQTQLLNWRK